MDENNTDTTIPGNLTQFFTEDLTNIDISRPLLARGVYRLKLTDISVDTNDAQKETLKCIFKTEFDTTSSKGQKLNPGFTVFHNVSLTPTEKYPKERIMEELKKLRFGLTSNIAGGFGDPQQYLGLTCDANVIVQVDKAGQYPNQNRIQGFTPVKS